MILQKDIDDQYLLKNRIDSRPTTRNDTEKEIKDVLHQKQTVLEVNYLKPYRTDNT